LHIYHNIINTTSLCSAQQVVNLYEETIIKASVSQMMPTMLE